MNEDADNWVCFHCGIEWEEDDSRWIVCDLCDKLITFSFLESNIMSRIIMELTLKTLILFVKNVNNFCI